MMSKIYIKKDFNFIQIIGSKESWREEKMHSVAFTISSPHVHLRFYDRMTATANVYDANYLRTFGGAFELALA